MRKIYFLLLVIILSCTIFAQVEPEDLPLLQGDENITSVLQPLAQTLQPLFRELSVLVGGIFGLYIILLLIRVHYERKKVKILYDIRYDLDRLNQHYALPVSTERRRLRHKIKKLIKSFIFKSEQPKGKKK